MSMADLLLELENWYAAQTDGDWEHSFGVEISTLDNPGWAVTLDLTGTLLQDRSFSSIRVHRDSRDWYECSVASNQFRGFGGARNLKNILEGFVEWKTRCERSS
jgi:hypothetical protein